VNEEHVTDEPLRLPEQVTLRYRFAAGQYASTFFTTLKEEQRLLARRCPNGHVLLPPRPVCGLCNVETEEWVEVGPRATLGGYTVVHVPFTDPMTGVGRPVPYGFGLIRFDGCDTNVYHLIDETDASKLSIGLPVEPVWRDASERTGSFADIVHFRPLYEEGA
jgi:uncharacterized OB-fold protein